MIEDMTSGIIDMIKALPKLLQLMVGELEVPGDEGQSMSEAIVDGMCIGASDGLLQK